MRMEPADEVPAAARKAAGPRVADPEAAANVPVSTGVRRLDQLLGGGLPPGSTTLLYGTPYTGKTPLLQRFFLQGPRTGAPSILLVTDTAAAEASEALAAAEPRLREWEGAGLATYVDAYAHVVGDPLRRNGVVYVDGLERLDGLGNALDRLSVEAARLAPLHRLAVQSLSTLLVEAGSTAVFKFLRVLTGRLRRTGGTALLCLDAGMHPESDVHAMKHLCSGAIHLREQDDRRFLRVEGLPTAYQPGWVEYDFSSASFDLTGSFSSERIRSMVLSS
jgi:KaiC/GvpD/RAD55 family RecA-like ATPase